MNKNNPAAIGTVLESDYTLVPSDNIRINHDIEKAKQIMSKLSSIDNEIKGMDNKLFTSLGKWKHGEEVTHKAFEDQIGKITVLQTKVGGISNNLDKMKEKCPRLFKVHYSKPISQKKKEKAE